MKKKDLNKEKLDDLTSEEAEEMFIEKMANLLVQQVLIKEEKVEK